MREYLLTFFSLINIFLSFTDQATRVTYFEGTWQLPVVIYENVSPIYRIDLNTFFFKKTWNFTKNAWYELILTFLLPNNSAVVGGWYIFLIITYKERDIAQIHWIDIWTVLAEEHRRPVIYSMGLKHLFE